MEISQKTEQQYLIRLFSLHPRTVIKHCDEIGWDFFRNIIEAAEYQLQHKEFNNINDQSISAWTSFIDEQYLHHPDGQKITSPFFFVVRIAQQLLKIFNEKPVSKTEFLGYWHSLTANLGEDLFTTALMAYRKYRLTDEPLDFQWEKIIKSDFHSLQSLLKQSNVSENHMHLRGSSPYFDLNWLSLMNFPSMRDAEFQKLSVSRSLKPKRNDSFEEDTQISLYELVKIAACLRLQIFTLCCSDNESKFEYLNPKILLILQQKELLNIYFSDFVSEISAALQMSEFRKFSDPVDYLLDFPINQSKSSSVLAGERKLYYSAYLYILENKKYAHEINHYFFLYILITQLISSEFIQKNERYGFKNFESYQNRKAAFIPVGSVYNKLMVSMAIRDNMSENNINKLEARFHGSDDPISLFNVIKCIDSFCQRNRRNTDYLLEPCEEKFNHFYVLHFIKRPCKSCKLKVDSNDLVWYTKCRDYFLRETLKQEAITIVKLRKNNLKTAERILGIDAASDEITCRPEVFAQAFRYLRDQRVVSSYPFNCNSNELYVPNLRVTYHVGEDFFDLLDGFRAIDEAIEFLELRYGDRIGHGVALGLDIKEYYSIRNNAISLPRQNLLDNIAWMLYKIRLWNIKASSSFIETLRSDYRKFFKKIYKSNEVIDLSEYIQTMELRGENPELFYWQYDKREELLNETSTRWDKYASTKESNFYYDLSKKIYDQIQAYHYDLNARKSGYEVEVFPISDDFISCMEVLQINLRQKIEDRGIAVESNPTSNYLISNLGDLNKIPIFKLFPIDEVEAGVKRLNVSVNTDDQGVFYTSLTKEYSMLAHIQQQQRNPDGSRKYSNDQILDWIEKLIENGNRQSFWISEESPLN